MSVHALLLKLSRPLEAEQPADADLVSAARMGDPSAFAEIVRRHQKPVYNLAFRMLHNAQDAEDVTQEAFLAALRRLNQLRSPASLGGWLRKIAGNLCLARAQSKPKTAEVALAELPEATAGEEDWERHHLMVETRRAIQKLPPIYRLAIVSYYLEGRSYREIAQTLGVPERTLKTRLYRARHLLREMLREVLDTEEFSR